MVRRTRALLALALVAGFALAVVPASGAAADNLGIDFESGYTMGPPNGQDGWVATGSDGSGCALYDHEIVSNSGAPTSFGDYSLRMSNNVTSGCFSDQTFSKPLTAPAGESTADGGAYSSSNPDNHHFEATWDFTSADPMGEQSGLSVVASPDRGDGARMSWVQMADTSGGLEVNFFDYLDLHPQGATNPADGCSGSDDFMFKPVATGLDRGTVHTVKLTVDFLEGPANDVSRVWVDGDLKAVDTSWEDYFRYCEGNPTRTVDSLLFRTGGPACGSCDGKGFLIDNINLSSGAIPDITTDGAWELYPSQSTYESQVRQPINANGTSNFPKKRGALPLQFDLLKSTGEALLPAIISDTDDSNDFGFLKFTPSSALNFADVQTLSADYDYLSGNCFGGAIRWQVRVDVGHDGDTSNDGNLFIYYGDLPGFTNCTGASSQSGANMVGMSDARYDLSQVGGPFYGTYAQALSIIGEDPVLRASLVNDTFGPDSLVLVNGANFNGTLFTPDPVGALAPTCDLPAATLAWTQNDPNPSGAINDSLESVQNKDAGEFFRNVDCKYIYNLDVSSLGPLSDRAGTYRVWVVIDGNKLVAPAKFDLR